MANVTKTEQLYEGKAKKVFATNDPDLVIVDYKDDATAFNGLKKGQISGKGVVNNKMSNFLMKIMEKNESNMISGSPDGVGGVPDIITSEELKRLLNMSECALFIAKPGAEIEILFANARFYSMLQYTSKEYKEKYGNSLMAAVLPEGSPAGMAELCSSV